MPLDFAITALVTLFVVVDPVGFAPTLLAVTEGRARPRAATLPTARALSPARS
jgi:small neutral amino acid transporter SnatA (MarC family)